MDKLTQGIMHIYNIKHEQIMPVFYNIIAF